MIDTIATKAVDQNAGILTALAKKIWANPETAFNEVNACKLERESIGLLIQRRLETPVLRWRQVMLACRLPSVLSGARDIR